MKIGSRATILALISLVACTQGKVEPTMIQYASAVMEDKPSKPGAVGWDLSSISPQDQHEAAKNGAMMLPNKDGSAYDIITARFEFGCDAKPYYRLNDTVHLNEAGQFVKTEASSQETDVQPDTALADMRAVACSGKRNATDATVQAASVRQWALDQGKNPTRGLTDAQAAPAAGS